MGKAVIVSELGEGLYTVRKEIAGLELALTLLAERRAELEKENPEWRDAVDKTWDEVQVMRQTLNAMIRDWESTAFDAIADLPTERDKPSEAEKQNVIDLTNAERAKESLPPLTENPNLANAAQGHADWMENNPVSHDGPGGNTWHQRIQSAGYNPSRTAENIAAGQKTPEEVVAAWMASPGHRRNIMNPALTEIGIGTGTGEYGKSWVQNFGTPV